MSAEGIWGTSVWETEEWIRNKHQNPKLRVASIGIAGERGVRYAAVINDLHRAAGRSGVGAVMGSKNLKAIAARGTKGVTVENPSEFMKAVRHTKELLANDKGRKDMTAHGTNSMLTTMQEYGGLPTRNFQEVEFEGYDLSLIHI